MGGRHGAPSAERGGTRRKIRILVGILAACACVVGVMTVAEEHLHDEVHQRKMALFRARGGEDLEGGEGVKMTPELARGILDLPERDQKELLTQTGNKESQMRILETVVLSAEGHAAEDGHDIHGHTEHHGLSGHHGHHVATPAQNRVQRQWALIFVTAIVTASVTFETLKEITIENTPPTMIKVVEKFFGELATLGFIGTISFVLTTDFGDTQSFLGGLSFTYTGDSHLLIHEFHTLHFLVFFVMVFFVGAVLVILTRAAGQKDTWNTYQRSFDELLKMNDLHEQDLQKLMYTPSVPLSVEATVTHEYTQSEQMKCARFLCSRQRFLDDDEVSVKIPPDFDYALYLTLRISSVLAEVVEIGVYDWLVLWIVYLVIFCVNATVQHLTAAERGSMVHIYIIMVFFLFLQVFLLGSAVNTFRMLCYMQHMLQPYVGEGDRGGFYGSMTKNTAEPEYDPDRSVHAWRLIRRVELEMPRYIAKMKLVKKESDMTTTERVFSLWFPARMANRHEQLFGMFGTNGPSHILRLIKLILLGSVVSVSCLVTIFAPYFWSVSPVLLLLAMVPACIAIALMPRMISVYTVVCSTEMMKNHETIIQVVRKQKQDKLINVLRILSMLSYFLDQIAFLKKISEHGGDLDDKGAISDERWNSLVESTDPKVVEDLEALFNAFDDDHSGELDEGEVAQLVAQLGTKLSPEENHNLFRIMDADGGGTVDFREFATVILHQKKCDGGNMNFSELGEKMFAIFDKDGSGRVSQEEIIDQMMKMGKNWDHSSLSFFLQELDKDGDGEIEKGEFIAYIQSIEAEANN